MEFTINRPAPIIQEAAPPRDPSVEKLELIVVGSLGVGVFAFLFYMAKRTFDKPVE